MDPHTINLVNVLNELWHMEHAQDVKMFASLFVFITTFATGTFIFYDFVRGKRRKLAGTRMHSLLLSLSVFFYTVATFTFTRTLDALQDMAYMLANPGVATTLSQRSVILEIPLILVGLSNIVFIGLYYKLYHTMPYTEECKNKGE